MGMKRNKRTVLVAHNDLAPLTEHILSSMGKDGAAIRQRLKIFYQERGCEAGPVLEPSLETRISEVA
jgi:hypothetical protein